MRLALLSDIHGNRVALDAVIADARAHGADTWWVLGDLVALGAEPVSTMETLTNLPEVAFVRGNTDRYVVTGARPFPHAADVERDPSLRPLFHAIESSFTWTRLHLEATGWIDHLASLPTAQRTTLTDGTRLLGMHASPSSDDGPGITPEIPEPELEQLLIDADADIVCGGHTHQPTDRQVGSVRAINLGSVSNPMTSDLRASYVLIDDDPQGHRVIHRRVAYDHDAVLAGLAASNHPEADYIASFQRGDQVRHPAVRSGAPTVAE